MVNYKKDTHSTQKTEEMLQKALIVAAKMKAFPRKMSASELESVIARATEENRLHAIRKVKRMYNRLWLIKLGGMTIIFLGLIFLVAPTSFFIAASTISIGLGIIIGAVFFGWKTGVFEIPNIFKKHRIV